MKVELSILFVLAFAMILFALRKYVPCLSRHFSKTSAEFFALCFAGTIPCAYPMFGKWRYSKKLEKSICHLRYFKLRIALRDDFNRLGGKHYELLKY
jgi:hypothetical protein